MQNHDDLERENQALRNRLSRLSEASLHINESLDLDAVLQGVLDSARSLTDASYALSTTLDGSGRVEDFRVSGLSPDEAELLWAMPEGLRFFEYLSSLPGPLRVADFAAHARSMGLPEFRAPAPVSSFLAAPIRHQGEGVGNIYVAKSEPGLEFSPQDEEILVMFASQAALVIANARRHRDEQRARADLEALIDTSPVGVAVFDAGNGALVSFNQETARILEALRTPDHPVEQLLEVLTFRRADGREVSLQELTLPQALSAGETVRAEEVVFGVPDGRSVTVMMNATPIRSEEGELESVVVTLQDMTALEELDRLRAEFLGMVSHELRVPLAAIKGSAATLLGSGDSLDPAEMDLFFRIIEQQADQMSGLITDLLDMARIDAGELPVAPAPSDPVFLVDQAKNTFLSGGSGNNIHIDLEPDLPLVMADRRRIVQVLGNLLSNAARHSPESSAIRLSVVRDRTHAAFSVADDGAGFSAEFLPQLFRKFSRLGGANRDDGLAGSGLGLAICRGIVEAHGGRIWAESDGPGQGASFTFTLPAVDDGEHTGPSVLPDAGALPRPAGRNRPRVLAVDDDPQTLRYLRNALSDAGFAPTVTGDPRQLGRLLEETRPHLVLLDLVLPGADGIELLETVPGLAGVPVIFLSAYGRDQTIARALEAGAVDYIVKPFSPTELAARIRTALRQREAPEPAEPSGPYRSGELTIDYAEQTVFLADRPVPLTSTEYRLLSELSVNAGRVLGHEHLLQRVWGQGHAGHSGPVRTAVKNIRHKLGDDADSPNYIFNRPRVGYWMPEPSGQGGLPS